MAQFRPVINTTERYFLRRGRDKGVVDEVLDQSFAGVLVSDFYAAYHHYDGPKQRCWAHLLRDIHDLQSLYPDDTPLARWAAAVHQLYRQAAAFTHPAAQQRRTAQLALERRLLALCRPFLNDPRSGMTRWPSKPGCVDAWRTTSRNSSSSWPNPRCHRTTTPPSAVCAIWWSAARSAGGTRSHQGTDTKMTLASIFGTWRAQGLNPLTACQQLLTSPQV